MLPRPRSAIPTWIDMTPGAVAGTRKLARMLGTNRKQVMRWEKRGLSVHDPIALAAELSRQKNPGSTLDRLTEPERVEAILAELDQPQPTH